MNIKCFIRGENGLENQNKKMENLTKVEDLYRLKVGDMYVDMIYAKNKKSFHECMVNIIKQKMKKGMTNIVNWYKQKNEGEKIMARTSKYDSTPKTIIKQKIWSVALYIRLSQEDEDNRQWKTRKQ